MQKAAVSASCGGFGFFGGWARHAEIFLIKNLWSPSFLQAAFLCL
jgi:hypothetical protein